MKDSMFTEYAIMPCPFCGKMPEFEITGTSSNGREFGPDIRFGCSSCGVYPRETGHKYRLSFYWDVNSEIVRIVKDDRPNLIRIWNNRTSGDKKEEGEDERD